jgi:hypothetical protein
MRATVRRGTLVVTAVFLVGCGNSTGPGFYYVPIGGTYSGTLTYQMTGDAPLTTPLVPGIAIQMNDPDGGGNFGGTFAFNNGYTGAGTIAAQFQPDGVTIAWEQFGDANQPMFYVSQFLTLNYPKCNFGNAAFALDPYGGFDGNGNIFLDGVYTGISCAINTSGDSVATSMNVSLAAFNPFPEATQRPSHDSVTKSIVPGGSQHVH